MYVQVPTKEVFSDSDMLRKDFERFNDVLIRPRAERPNSA
jgi:hypothetical protein